MTAAGGLFRLLGRSPHAGRWLKQKGVSGSWEQTSKLFFRWRKLALGHDHFRLDYTLVAYPEHWDQSGIMTFIVNQDGKIFQRNLGEKTSRIAGAMKEYIPASEWTLVQDEGVSSVVSEP